MTGLYATTIISGSTLLQLIVYALVAGLGVMGAFSALIYCVERAQTLRRADQPGAAALFQVASVLATAAVIAIVVYGLILLTSKPK